MWIVVINIIPAIYIGFLIQIVLHEIGHLIGGFLTGWKFLYIQIYRFVLKKDNKQLKIIRVSDIGYKCIMYPKSFNTKAMTYTMSGCMLNLISAALGLIIMLCVSLSTVLWLYIWSFTAYGIGLFLMNGISSVRRVCNDKACYNLLAADKHNKLCHNAQLITARHLMDGLTYYEIGEEIISLCPDIAINDIQAYQAVLEYYYHLDTRNHLKMGQALNKIRGRDNISKDVLDIVDMELLYVRLICGINLQVKMNSIKGNNKTNKLDMTINGAETFIFSKRVDAHTYRVKSLYEAYEHFAKGCTKEAIETLNKAIKSMDMYGFVYEGERKFCIRQLVEIKKVMELYY